MNAPIIMVHGAFCGGWCFDDFRRPFEAAGYEVIAPDLRAHGSGANPEAVTGVSMREYGKQIAEIAQRCTSPPILLGHSMGGLVIQLASLYAPVRALVLVAPSPAWGQPVTSYAELIAAFALYTRGAYWLEPIAPDYPSFRSYAFDRLTEAQSRRLYKHLGPESGRALFEIMNWWLDPMAATFVPPTGPKPPALVLGGGNDRIHSPKTLEPTAARLGAPLKIFPEMSHWTIGEPGWEDVAETALQWLDAVPA